MPEQRFSFAEVLDGLARRLSDDALAACFQELAPSAVRAALVEAARLLARQPPGEGASRRPGLPSPAGAEPAGKRARLSLFTDGASRGNPGEAGAGLVLLDEHGREVAARAVYLGQCTNNVAEYRALLMGLREAVKWAPQEIAIHLDSELIVRQLLGSYQVKDSKLKPLHAEAVSLLEGFSSYRLTHVPREENRRADQLANQGIEQAGSATPQGTG